MNKKGFSLLEIILYIALVSVVLTAVTYFAWDVISGSVKAHALQEVQQNARFVLDRMSQEIRKAESINSLTSSTLSLDNGDDPDVILTFDEINKKITIKEGAGDPQDLTSAEIEVSSCEFVDMSFTYTGSTEPMSENVKIILELNYYNPENLQDWLAEDSFETTVELKGN